MVERKRLKLPNRIDSNQFVEMLLNKIFLLLICTRAFLVFGGPTKHAKCQCLFRVNSYRNGLSARRPLSPRQRPDSGHSWRSASCQEETHAQHNDSRPIVAPTKSAAKRACKCYASALARFFWIDVHRFDARDRKLSCARARRRRRTQRGASDRNRADRFRRWRNYFSRRPNDPSASIWMWDAGSRQRRHRTLQSVACAASEES